MKWKKKHQTHRVDTIDKHLLLFIRKQTIEELIPAHIHTDCFVDPDDMFELNAASNQIRKIS